MIMHPVRTLVAEEDDAPEEGREPQARVLVGLVLADHDGVRHGQQAHLQPDTTRPADTAGLSDIRQRYRHTAGLSDTRPRHWTSFI
jgi:hypothetical protein